MIEKIIGKVKWFKPKKGYGYIIGYDNQTYYFEIDSLLIDIKKIKTGLIVKFIPNSFASLAFADQIEEL